MTFQMWSPFHYLFIISPFMLIIVFYFLFKKCDEKTLRLIGMYLSLVGIALLVGRNTEIYLKADQVNPEMIPLQICHLANFFLFFAFLFKSRVLFSIAFCFNMPAAFLSIVFADSLTNYATILNWQGMAYIWGHALIVGVVLWAYFNGMVHINLKTLRRIVWVVTGMFFSSIVINNLFMEWMPGFVSNYFYTMIPQSGTPLELIYNMGETTTILGLQVNPIYILLLLFVGLSVVFMFYGLYLILNKVRKVDRSLYRLKAS
ncbi:YwaF family protein [Jeotgalibacillus sp. ET6]|uniref:TMEM164 family acyltransferase n=1 Tax=Jeotgalibacillus sp. ET6 TaxID=3037260 RepID=UPI002418683F|nr:YwaF family protein [Jeotgalibacillus sp. ET6]MDG5473634.1 YwaF family protein [Jeotgalibacillus sp. ET6]